MFDAVVSSFRVFFRYSSALVPLIPMQNKGQRLCLQIQSLQIQDQLYTLFFIGHLVIVIVYCTQIAEIIYAPCMIPVIQQQLTHPVQCPYHIGLRFLKLLVSFFHFIALSCWSKLNKRYSMGCY